MNTIRISAAIIAAGALGATAALAQTTAPAQTTPPTTAPSTTTPSTMAPSAAAPAAAAPAATITAADVTDADVDQFATAVVAVQKIQQDSTIAATDKQAKMADAVKTAGLTPTKFNAIAQVSQSDPALMKRIQTAASAKMTPAAGKTPPAGK